tara:strand:- start:536 stop:3709 length:3174 start_codon:yes stop_codon:yes gene_type:complete
VVEKYKNFNDIFPDTNIITGIDKNQGPYTSGEEIFGEELTPSTDAALAKYAYGDPDMEIGEESLLDPKLRGRISAADTINEKIAEFKKAYPEGDLLFVPGKGTAESTLEGVPSKYSGGEILFRPDSTTPYARLDGNYFKGGSKEFLADFAEFIYDDLGVISGELAAGSKKVAKFIKPFTKPVPFLGTLTTGYDLLPLMTRMGLYGAAGELAQEGVQELRGVNEQTFKEIADTAGYKGLVTFVGTGVAEPVVRKIGDIFSGRGLLKRSDEAGEAILATKDINKILKDLSIKDKDGNILQIDALPANLLVDNPIVTRIGRQTAATGGLLSGQYRQINEALAQALKGVGDEESAGKLISLLQIATTLEKQRLLDLAYQASTGAFKFDTLNKQAQESIIQRFGIQSIDDVKNLSNSDVADIIAESVQAMTGPGGQLDLALDASYSTLKTLKGDNIKFDISDIKKLSTKEVFGTTQLKKSLDGDSVDLREIILNSLGENRLAVLDNNIDKIIGRLDDPSEKLIERITAREYRKYLTKEIGTDPLINIRNTNSTIEDITRAIRDIGEDGAIQLPTGAGGGKVDIFDFLMDARNQLMEINFAPIGEASRVQRATANKLIAKIDAALKNPTNAGPKWGKAYNSFISLQDEQLKLMNLPIVLSLNGKGNYTQLLKGYMLPNYTKNDINLLFGAMDDKGKIAFKQGFVNQLIGDDKKLRNLPELFEQFDPDVMKYVLGQQTYSSIEMLSGFVKKMDDAGLNKILDTQVKFGKAIDGFMANNNTKGINDALQFIINHSDEVAGKTVTGFNTPLGQAFHDGIVNRLFTNSTSKIKGKLQIDLGAYRKYVQQLKDNGIFDTFDKKTQKLLEDTDLVKDFLVQAGDAGTSIEAASLADAVKGIGSGRTEPGSLIGQFAEIIGLGKLFTTSAGRAFLVGSGKQQLKASTVNKVIGGVAATLITPDDKALSEFAPLLNILPFVENVGKDEEQEVSMAPTPDTSFSPNPESRLSNINMSSPIGAVDMAAMPTNTGAMNMDTMARGSQLFGGPREITFAAQGGIMNARKPIQRVA